MSASYFGTGITLTVGVAFGKGAGQTAADGDFTDVTSYVRGAITIESGRTTEQDSFQAGQCVVTLANGDRRFDPEYAAGPYFGSLLPMRHLRVQVTYGGTTATRFRGFVQGWPQTWELVADDKDATVTVVALDALSVLAFASMPESAYAAEVLADTPYAWYRLGEPVGDVVMADSSGNNRHGQYVANADDGMASASALASGGEDGARSRTLAGAAYRQPMGWAPLAIQTGTTVTLEWLQSFDAPASMTSTDNNWPIGQGTYSYGSTGVAFSAAKPYFGVATNDQTSTTRARVALLWCNGTGTDGYSWWRLTPEVFDKRPHHFAVTRNGATATLYVDGVAKTWDGTVGTALFAGALAARDFVVGGTSWPITYDELAIYSSALSAARVEAHALAALDAFEGEGIDDRITRVIEAVGLDGVLSTALGGGVHHACPAFTPAGADAAAYLASLVTAERGRLFVAGDGTVTFLNRLHDQANTTVAAAFTDASGTTAPYAAAAHAYDVSRVVNVATVSRYGSSVVWESSNATSVTNYGRRAADASGVLVATDNEALAYAQYQTHRYATPAARVTSLVVPVRRNVAVLAPIMRDLDIGDRVTFRRAPMRGTAFTYTLAVEGIRHSISVEGDWTAELLTSPIDTTTYLTLGDATAGKIGTGAYAY